MKKFILASVLGLLTTGAMAHSPLKSTTPADAAVIAEVPANVLLEFTGKLRLTRVTTTHADEEGVDLDLSGHKGFASKFTIPMKAMGNGAYIIDWRGLGADGHTMKGSFGFVVE
jgi:methionine-rich copper-binding protein CopC